MQYGFGGTCRQRVRDPVRFRFRARGHMVLPVEGRDCLLGIGRSVRWQ